MSYKRYIKKNGKIYGPYTYESKWIDGKVSSNYVKRDFDKINFVLVSITILLVTLGLFSAVYTNPIIKTNYKLNELEHGVSDYILHNNILNKFTSLFSPKSSENIDKELYLAPSSPNFKKEYLTAYWSMDEINGTRYDYIGDNDFYEYQTMGGYKISSTTGKWGKSIAFNYSNVRVYLSAPSNRDSLSPSKSMAISFWFNKVNSSYVLQVEGANSAGNQDYFLLSLGYNNSIYANIKGRTSYIEGLTELNTWQHIVFIANGSNFFVYKDGVKQPVNNSYFYGIGGSNLFIRGWMSEGNASLDELGFWKDPVFANQADMDSFAQSLYNDGKGVRYQDIVTNSFPAEGAIASRPSSLDIDTCQNLNEENMIYILINNVSADTRYDSYAHCFDFKDKNITLDCDGHKIDGQNVLNNFSKIKNCVITGSVSAGFNSTIENNIIISDDGSYAVNIAGVSGVNITKNNITGSYAGIYSYNSNYTSITFNEIRDQPYPYPSWTGTVYLIGSYNNKIESNKIWGLGTKGIYLGGGSNNIINNTITTSWYGNYPYTNYGIQVTYLRNSNILGNNITTNIAYPISIEYYGDSFNNQINGNTGNGKVIEYYHNLNSGIIENKDLGQLIVAASKGVIVRNVNVTSSGVVFIQVNDSTITNSNLSCLRGFGGINLKESNRINISNNKIGSGSYEGIAPAMFIQSITNSNIEDNSISGSVYLRYVSGVYGKNTIRDNNILGYFPIYLYNSDNQLIYNNILNYTWEPSKVNSSSSNFSLSNKITGKNIVNGSYIGGNYWTNPSKTGFSDTCVDTNYDGICDSSFIVDSSSSKDYFPLAKYIPDTQAPSVTLLTESPIDPTSYSDSKDYLFNSTITEITIISNASLEFNGINYTATKNGDVYSVLIRNIGAGVYNYRWFAKDVAGNINNSQIGSYTINKNNSYTLSISATTPITYGTITDVQGSGCPSQLTCSMNLANGIYGVGTTIFNYSTSGNANYTANSTTKNIAITQANSLVYTYINNLRANLTISRGTSVWLGSSRQTGEGNTRLYKDGILIGSGIDVQNYVLFDSAGLFNITSVYLSTQNYSTSYETWWLNVTCTQNLAYTDYTLWQNQGQCKRDDLQLQNQSRVQYDINNCGSWTNITEWYYRNVTCNYCSYNITNTTKSNYINTTCSGNQMNQSRNWTQYDSNYSTCYGVTGIASDLFANITWYEYQLIGPIYQNTSWSSLQNQTSCRINDTILQNQSRIQFDIYKCVANTTIWDYTETSCNYCSYNITNTTWTDWQNISCLANDKLNQSRNRTQYDSNYSTCYTITGLISDLWNNGNNITYFEYRQTESCDFCIPDLRYADWTNWENVTLCLNDKLNQSRNRTQYDLNQCSENQTIFENKEIYCGVICDLNIKEDANCDGIVTQSEIDSYKQRFLDGDSEINLQDVALAIKRWVDNNF